MTRIVRGVGWTLVGFGAVVLLYVVYLLWFTDLSTNASQRELSERFEAILDGSVDGSDGGVSGSFGEDGLEPDDAPRQARDAEGDHDIEPGEAYAALWFERDGDRIVSDEVLFVVSGVTLDDLRLGPGHYPDSARPGGADNFAVAGHRTTYGRPFWALDDLRDGDTIHVIDRQGREWVYAYREQRVVSPSDVWVVGDDPLGTGAPTITLTTCHPRFSAAQRLIAWGELIGEPLPDETGA